MRWTVEHEDDTLQKYEFIYDTNVTRCRFIQHPTIEMTGASHDGFIGEDS